MWSAVAARVEIAWRLTGGIIASTITFRVARHHRFCITEITAAAADSAITR